VAIYPSINGSPIIAGNPVEQKDGLNGAGFGEGCEANPAIGGGLRLSEQARGDIHRRLGDGHGGSSC
jgi:hypothetical protein